MNNHSYQHSLLLIFAHHFVGRKNMETESLFEMRMEYAKQTLDESSIEKDPVVQFTHWWHEATESKIQEPNAMTLATVDEHNMADARIVLLKAFDDKGFVFFTNYNSAKSAQITSHPNCCLLFHWKELERQVRIVGPAEKISTEESIAYFNSRPEGSKIGAWASPQSMVVAGKAWLEETFNFYKERLQHGAIPKPPHWGGYRVKPQRMEFWQGRPNRMHDRIQYARTNEQWAMQRLAP